MCRLRAKGLYLSGGRNTPQMLHTLLRTLYNTLSHNLWWGVKKPRRVMFPNKVAHCHNMLSDILEHS